jgi:CrcB protein
MLISIAMGGATGSVLRFVFANWLTKYANHWFAGASFPLATLVVNVTGSFCIGLVYVWIDQGLRDPVYREFVRGFLIVGVLGGFTTFSTFSLETVQLATYGFWSRAMLNIIASVVACVTAAWAGLLIGRWWLQA